MTAEQEILIEQELCGALRAFHDLEDKEKRYAYSKEYFWDFCERYGLEVFPIVKRTLKRKSEFVFSDYTDSVKFLDSEIKNDGEERNKWIALALCLCLGYFGIHKFYDKKIGMGILYLFTMGIFGIGIIIDVFGILAKPDTYYV